MRGIRFNALAGLALALTFCAAGATPLAQTPKDAARAAQGAEFYSCPMHPEVRSKKKGQCPKCKMDLRLTQAEGGGDAGHAAQEAASAAPRPSAEAQPAGAPAVASKMTIPDVELLDQDGRRVRFYTDLVKGKVVAVQFIFTTCTTICPPLGATFARVQRELGERAGRDVHLISISVDPATDTPERMKAWGAKFHAGPGWTFVTGPKPQVDELLRALGAGVASPADHTPAVLVGNEEAGQWRRAYGLASPSTLVKLIDDAAARRLDAAKDSDSKEAASR